MKKEQNPKVPALSQKQFKATQNSFTNTSRAVNTAPTHKVVFNPLTRGSKIVSIFRGNSRESNWHTRFTGSQSQCESFNQKHYE